MKCCCAENENVHIVEIVCTRTLGRGIANVLLTAALCPSRQLSVFEYYLVTDRSQICGHYNLGDWKKVIRE